MLVVATPDAAIGPIAAAVGVDTAAVAHLSGSLGLEVLGPHERRAAIHPLVSLPNPDVGSARLVGAWFAIGGDPIAAQVVQALGGKSFEVADEHRALYHAAACIASNHLVALLGQVERVAASAGVPLEAYLELVRETVENVATLGPTVALTGPVARGDTITMARHLEALPEDERAAYEAMAESARRLLAVRS